MTHIELFRNALAKVRLLKEQYPSSRALESVIEQLEYLIGIESGARIDRSKLRSINIGVIAAREIEDMNMQTAEELHAVSAVARQLAAEGPQ